MAARRSSAHRRDRVRRELRDLVLRLAMGGGCLLGLYWMISTLPTDAAAGSCKGKNSRIGECTGDTLVELLAPSLAKVGVGVFGGALLAIIIIGVMPGLRRRHG